jgi:protease I
MATAKLSGKKIAFLATDGFEQVELTRPWQAAQDAGAEVHLIAPESSPIQGMHHHEKGELFPVDKSIDQVNAENYDGLVLPGGVANPDALRTNEPCVQFVREFFKLAKPVAAICHGPWTLIEADVVHERKVTSWPSLKTDLRNAGAEWVDQACVCDSGLVTSRNPDDLDVFCEKIIEVFAQGTQVGQTV